jgi:AcrR family transcriptional regulator
VAEALGQARQPRGRGGAGAWQWAKTAETQRALLDAAREVFTERGFASTSITDIVKRSGSSVGSVYHHFGGKSEMFLALWEEYSRATEDAAEQAIAHARRPGTAAADPLTLFSVGARAYLDACWQHRELAALFRSGDAPPGFGTLAREDGCQWISQVDTLDPSTSSGRLYVTILASLVREGAREVADSGNRRQATKTIGAVLEYARRLMAPGPWQPPVKSASS